MAIPLRSVSFLIVLATAAFCSKATAAPNHAGWLTEASGDQTYPRVIRGNGEVCVQDLTISGAVEERCRPESSVRPASLALIDRVRLDTKRELHLLIDQRPGFGSTIAVGVLGGVLLIGGGSILGYGLSLANQGRDFFTSFFGGLIGVMVGAIGVVIGAFGIAMLIVSMVKYFGTRVEQSQHDEKIQALEDRLDELDRTPSPSLPPASTPMPQVSRTPAMTFELARF